MSHYDCDAALQVEAQVRPGARPEWTYSTTVVSPFTAVIPCFQGVGGDPTAHGGVTPTTTYPIRVPDWRRYRWMLRSIAATNGGGASWWTAMTEVIIGADDPSNVVFRTGIYAQSSQALGGIYAVLPDDWGGVVALKASGGATLPLVTRLQLDLIPIFKKEC